MMKRTMAAVALAAVLAPPTVGIAGQGAPDLAERAADSYVAAVDAGSLDRLVESFAPDGVVIDVERRIRGREAIRRWAAAEVIGGTLRVIERRPHPGGVTFLVHWAPKGESGWRALYRFEVDIATGRIREASLQYA